MRLIDSDAFIDFIRNLPKEPNGFSKSYDESAIVRFVRIQPTAYDVEAVVAELEYTKENFEKDCSYWKEHSWKDNALYNEADLNEKQADCYADAISIVRGKE